MAGAPSRQCTSLTDDDIEWGDLPAEDKEALAAEAEADALP